MNNSIKAVHIYLPLLIRLDFHDPSHGVFRLSNTMFNRFFGFTTGCLLAGSILVANALAAPPPPEVKEIKCGGERCGTMEISTYESVKGLPDKPDSWGSRIIGKITETKNLVFHIVQSLIIYDDRDPGKLKFTDGTELPAQFVDTPPGGYLGQKWDYKPYFDEQGELPDYFDTPTMNVRKAKDEPDKKLQMSFETWVVCTIQEIFGDKKEKASDDTFKISPLLGWTWGYTLTYIDNMDGVEDLKDFKVDLDNLAWLEPPIAPSALWSSSLLEIYGAAPNQDNFNIVVGDCKNCIQEVPAPLPILGVGSGLLYARRLKKLSIFLQTYLKDDVQNYS